MEIERKFLIETPPDLGDVESDAIEQGYLSDATEGGTEVRLRRRDARLTLTAKSGGGLARDEVEISLDEDQFGRLWPLTEGRRVTERRYLIGAGELTVELDVYAGVHEGLIVAEVEFSDEAAAGRFEPPDWFGEEVTGRADYRNASLATK